MNITCSLFGRCKGQLFLKGCWFFLYIHRFLFFFYQIHGLYRLPPNQAVKILILRKLWWGLQQNANVDFSVSRPNVWTISTWAELKLLSHTNLCSGASSSCLYKNKTKKPLVTHTFHLNSGWLNNFEWFMIYVKI